MTSSLRFLCLLYYYAFCISASNPIFTLKPDILVLSCVRRFGPIVRNKVFHGALLSVGIVDLVIRQIGCILLLRTSTFPSRDGNFCHSALSLRRRVLPRLRGESWDSSLPDLTTKSYQSLLSTPMETRRCRSTCCEDPIWPPETGRLALNSDDFAQTIPQSCREKAGGTGHDTRDERLRMNLENSGYGLCLITRIFFLFSGKKHVRENVREAVSLSSVGQDLLENKTTISAHQSWLLFLDLLMSRSSVDDKGSTPVGHQRS